MDYKVEENRIIASDDQQPFVGEISPPKLSINKKYHLDLNSSKLKLR